MSSQEQKPSFPLYPNQQVKTISYAPMDSVPSTVKNTDNSMLFFKYTSHNKPELIAGNGIKLAFSYNRYQQLQNLTSKELMWLH